LVVLGILALPVLPIRDLVKRVTITLALVAMRVAVMPAAMRLTTGLSIETLMRVKSRVLPRGIG
jgi:hypothetical protein